MGGMEIELWSCVRELGSIQIPCRYGFSLQIDRHRRETERVATSAVFEVCHRLSPVHCHNSIRTIKPNCSAFSVFVCSLPRHQSRDSRRLTEQQQALGPGSLCRYLSSWCVNEIRAFPPRSGRQCFRSFL